MGATPSEVESNEVVRSGFEEKVNFARPEGFEVSGDEDTVRDFGGELLQVLPASPRLEGLAVEDGAVVSAKEGVGHRAVIRFQ